MVDEQTATAAHRPGTRSDRAIRVTTVVAVATVASVAAFVSYRHMRGVALQYGEDPITATVLPFSVDGLIVAASMAMLGDRRAGRRRSWLSVLLLVVGSCASLAANVLHADPTISSRVIAGWPPLALLGSYELLMRQIHADRRLGAAAPAPATPTAATAATATAVEPAAATEPGASSAPSKAATAVATTQMGATAPETVTATDPVPGHTEGGAPGEREPDTPSASVTRPSAAAVLATSHAPGTDDSGDQAAAGTASTGDEAGSTGNEGGEAAGVGRVDGQDADTDADADTAAGTRSRRPVRAGSAGPARPLAGLDTADPSVKRAAILRALDETGGSATAAVALLGDWGVTVSKSWVYQVRKETRYAGLETGPLPVPRPRAAHGKGQVPGRGQGHGRRRGMAPGPSLTLPTR